MSAVKHTPGPWRVEPCRCEPTCKRWIIDVPQNTDGRFDEADAKLIAAAPALADALEWALREIARPVGWDGPDADYEKAEAAIRAAGRLP